MRVGAGNAVARCRLCSVGASVGPGESQFPCPCPCQPLASQQPALLAWGGHIGGRSQTELLISIDVLIMFMLNRQGTIHDLMFGSATFLTPQYWSSQPNKHTHEPHNQRGYWDLFVASSLPSTYTSVSATAHATHRKGVIASSS